MVAKAKAAPVSLAKVGYAAVGAEGLHEWAEEHGLLPLLPAICAVEAAGECSWEVLQCLGQGTASGVQLSKCTDPVAMATFRAEVVTSLVKQDSLRLVIKYGPAKGTVTMQERLRMATAEVGRKITKMVELLLEFEKPAVAASLTRPGGIVLSTVEETSYSVPTFDTTEMKALMARMYEMYMMRLRTSELPTVGAMKKIMYAVRVEETFPDPARVTLESMRRDPSDKPVRLFSRLIYGVATCAAGTMCPAHFRDDGAGVHDSNLPPQWLNAVQVQELVKSIDEVRDALTDTEMLGMLKLLCTTIHHSTDHGKESPSLVFAHLVGRVPEMANAAKGGNAKNVGPGRERKPKRAAGAAAPGTPPTKVKTTAKNTPSPKKSTKYPDVVGEKGPNDLPRMVGGNPAGEPCRDHVSGKCAFKTCSFKH